MISEIFIEFCCLKSNSNSIRLILCSTSSELCTRSEGDDSPNYASKMIAVMNSSTLTTWFSPEAVTVLTLKSLKMPLDSLLSASTPKCLSRIFEKLFFCRM